MTPYPDEAREHRTDADHDIYWLRNCIADHDSTDIDGGCPISIADHGKDIAERYASLAREVEAVKAELVTARSLGEAANRNRDRVLQELVRDKVYPTEADLQYQRANKAEADLIIARAKVASLAREVEALRREWREALKDIHAISDNALSNTKPALSLLDIHDIAQRALSALNTEEPTVQEEKP